MDAYTFLLGDYNLNLKSSGASSPYVQDFVVIEDNGRRKELITVQDCPTTIRMHREIDPSTGELKTLFRGYANNYDHFTYDRISFSERGVTTFTSAIDTVNLYKMGDFEKHWREISDHIPIMLELSLK